MVEMLFEPQYEIYEGEDLSALIGDEWKEIEMNADCDCDCDYCGCQEGV